MLVLEANKFVITQFRLLLSILAALLIVFNYKVAFATDTFLSPVEEDIADGYVQLYNGKDLTGWKTICRKCDSAILAELFMPVEDRVLHVFKNLPDEYQLNERKNDTHGLMITEKKYNRFSFKFQYKWGKKKFNNFKAFQYDAGAFYHIFKEKVWPRGIEYQVRYNHLTKRNHTGDLWNLTGKPVTTWVGDDGTFILESDGGKPKQHIKGEHRALKDVPYHALDGQWNQSEIIVMDDSYAIHKLNGKIVNVLTNMSVKNGSIALQSETGEIFYRHILIKEFAKTHPIDYFLNKK